MPASPFDIVNALSSEELCPVCEELHASVDQRSCCACGTVMCPDCASLRPDTSWICSACVQAAPPRAFPHGRLPSPRAARLATLEAVREARLRWGGELGRGLKPWCEQRALHIASRAALLLSVLATAMRTLGAFVLRSLATWQQHARRVQPALQQRWLAAAARARPQLSRMQEQLQGARINFAALSVARVRVQLAERLLAMRSIPVREHAAAMLIGTAIQIGIARHDESRQPR